MNIKRWCSTYSWLVNNKKKSLKVTMMSGEMVQWLGTHVALPEHPSSVPTTRMLTRNIHNFYSTGFETPFLTSEVTHTWHTCSLSFSFFYFFIISFNLYFWHQVSCSPGQASNWLDKQGWPGSNFWWSCLHLLSEGVINLHKTIDLYLLCHKMPSKSSEPRLWILLWRQQESKGIRMGSLPSPLFTLETPSHILSAASFQAHLLFLSLQLLWNIFLSDLRKAHLCESFKFLMILLKSQEVVPYTFNPSSWEAEAGKSIKFKTSLVYKASFRTSRATQRNPFSKNQNPKQNKIKEIILNNLLTLKTKAV